MKIFLLIGLYSISLYSSSASAKEIALTFDDAPGEKTLHYVRRWLKDHSYRNIPSSIDNEDPVFSGRINEAKAQGRKIDYQKVKSLFLEHILTGVDFFDKAAVQTLGYSPKHIILLHQKDATVLFIDDLIKELQKRGWNIISATEAIKDPLYSMEPKNTMSSYGLFAQVIKDKKGEFHPYYDFTKLKQGLDEVVGLR